jgi:hypothetical protein
VASTAPVGKKKTETSADFMGDCSLPRLFEKNKQSIYILSDSRMFPRVVMHVE